MCNEPPRESALDVSVNSHQTPALAAYTRCDCAECPVASSKVPAIWVPMTTGAGAAVLLIVIVTGLALAVFPELSRATAASVWLPFAAVVVSQDNEYGAAVSSDPRFAPSSVNCTPATPTLSLAVAATVTVPETVAPPAGAVSVTLGAVVSGTLTVTAAVRT